MINICLKSDFYLRYRTEDLMTPNARFHVVKGDAVVIKYAPIRFQKSSSAINFNKRHNA